MAMRYEGRIFRPPSEANSLLLQATIGCSHNRCTFCSMYREKTFRVRPTADVIADIEAARAHGPAYDRVFLCDGDALTLSTNRLLPILEAIRENLPWVRRVGVYGDTRSVLSKDVAELCALRDAGLGIVYHGLESGDDEVLRRLQKGATAAAACAMADKLRAAGIAHSVIVLLGAGGVALSAAHAHATAACLSAMDPAYVGALALMVEPGTPLAADLRAGRFVLPDKFGLLAELATLIDETRVTTCRFSANHASNYLPLKGDLPRDQERLLDTVNRVLATRDERFLKPEFLRGL